MSRTAELRKDLWEVHHDPYYVTRVWVRNHHQPDAGWITLWWRQLASAPVSFGEDAWTHARKLIAERGHASPSEEEIARLVDDLPRRAAGTADAPSSSDATRLRHLDLTHSDIGILWCHGTRGDDVGCLQRDRRAAAPGDSGAAAGG